MKMFHSSPLTNFCLHSRKLSSSLLCVLGMFFIFYFLFYFFYLFLAWFPMLPTDILDLAFGHCAFLVTGCLLRNHLRFITNRILLGCWTFWFYPICSVNQVYKFLPAHSANIPCIHILPWLNEGPIIRKISLPLFPFLFIFQLSTAPSLRIIQPILFIIRPSYFLLTLNFLQHPTMVLQFGTA